MRHFIQIFFLLFASLLPLGLIAQQEAGLHFMPRAWQSQQTNPAFFNEKMIVVSLPSPHLSLSNTGFSFDDIVKQDPMSDSMILDIEGVLSGLESENFFRVHTNVDIFGLGIKLANIQVGINAGVRGRGYIYYPKSLLELAWEGNANRIGETISIAPDFQGFAYSEVSASVAYRIPDRFQFGARLKYLSGIADISAGKHLGFLTTEDEYYQLGIIADYQVNASGISLNDSTGGNEFAFSLSDNKGIAADIGFVLNLHKKLVLQGSILDLGSITWDKQVSNFEVSGEYEFDGIDASGLINGDSLEFASVLDTLEEIFDVVETETSYKTRLPMRIYVSAVFSPIKSLRLGAGFFQEYYRGRHFNAYSLSASKDLGKIFTGGLTWSVRERRLDNIGVNALLKLGPFVMYGVTDNLLDLTKPSNARNIHFRWGTNFTF